MRYFISPYPLGFVRDCLCYCCWFGLRFFTIKQVYFNGTVFPSRSFSRGVCFLRFFLDCIPVFLWLLLWYLLCWWTSKLNALLGILALLRLILLSCAWYDEVIFNTHYNNVLLHLMPWLITIESYLWQFMRGIVMYYSAVKKSLWMRAEGHLGRKHSLVVRVLD